MGAPHKRPRNPPDQPPDDGPTSKRRRLTHKVNHPSFPPPRFWDGLWEVPLTVNALRELDRRNAERAAHQSNSRGSHAPLDLFLSQSSAQLKRIEQFAASGGPDLTDLRGVNLPSIEMDASSQSSLRRRKRDTQPLTEDSTPKTKTTKSLRAYDRGFQQHLVQHDILPDAYVYPDGRYPPEPDNLDDIREALPRRRESLSSSRFTPEDFQKFRRASGQASREAHVMRSIISVIEGHVNGRSVATNVSFTNLDDLTDGSLTPGNPDIYYGASPEQLDEGVRNRLWGHVVPSTDENLPIAPNFFVEVKGPTGQSAVASRQLCYNMALGARGINSLLRYRCSDTVYDNRAYVVGFAYLTGHLIMYASHPIAPSKPGQKCGFVMTQVSAWALTGDIDTFRRGVAAYRNARDWAKEQRDNAINQANERAAREEAEPSESDGLGQSATSEASVAEHPETSRETSAGSNEGPVDLQEAAQQESSAKRFKTGTAGGMDE